MIPTEFTTFLGHSNSTSHGNVSGLQMIFQLKMVIFHRFKQIIIIHPNCWLYIPHYHIIFPLYSHYIPIIFPLFSPFLVGSTTRLSTYKLEITKQNSGLFFRHRSPSKKIAEVCPPDWKAQCRGAPGIRPVGDPKTSSAETMDEINSQI
jgi:hypothetical protein